MTSGHACVRVLEPLDAASGCRGLAGSIARPRCYQAIIVPFFSTFMCHKLVPTPVAPLPIFSPRLSLSPGRLAA